MRATGYGLTPTLVTPVWAPEALMVDEGAKEEPEDDQAQEDRDKISGRLGHVLASLMTLRWSR